MSYQTGTAATPTALKAIIESFATTNGWTVSGNVLSKGDIHAIQTVTEPTTISIQGANSSDGLTEPCPYTRSINVAAPNWPITYYLFYHPTPDMLVGVIKYGTDKVQTFIYGDIVKVHASAFVGGNLVFASDGDENRTILFPSVYNNFTSIDAYCGTDSSFHYTRPFIPFFHNKSSGWVYPGNGLCAKIDGKVWDGADATYIPQCFASQRTLYSLYFSPNTWNSQTHLIPIEIMYAMSSGTVEYLGYLEHIRYVRVDNYNLGDIITLGSDKWKVFPWFKKNTSYRNGEHTVASSGTVGLAVRYDGP